MHVLRSLPLAAIAMNQLAWLSTAAAQQPIAVGPEFQVNTYTTDAQYAPAVASDAAGNFVVVWYSDRSSGADASNSSIQGQRYDASGVALGSEFQINTYTTSIQTRPAIATDGSGGFVVVWESVGSAGTDTLGRSIQGQRYDSSGAVERRHRGPARSGRSPYEAAASRAEIHPHTVCAPTMVRMATVSAKSPAICES